jgi:hypothetical protein
VKPKDAVKKRESTALAAGRLRGLPAVYKVIQRTFNGGNCNVRGELAMFWCPKRYKQTSTGGTSEQFRLQSQKLNASKAAEGSKWASIGQASPMALLQPND